MPNPITIVVNAQTAEAARELSAFVSQTNAELEKVEQQSKKNLDELEARTLRLKASLGGGWGALPDIRELGSVTRTATVGIHGLTSAVGSNRIAMMELGHVARATVEGLAAGISPTRMLAMELPRVAQAATFSSFGIGTLGVAAAVLIPLILSGAAAWSAYQAKQEAARAEAEHMNQVLTLQQRNLEAVLRASAKNLISEKDADFLIKLLNIGTPAAMESAQKRLQQLGISEGQIDKLEQLQKLQTEMQRGAMESHEAERAKAYDVWRERMQEIDALSKASKLAADQRKQAEADAAAELGAKVKKINEDLHNQKFKKELEFVDDQNVFLLSAEQAAAKKREGYTQEEFDKRILLIREIAKKYPEAEEAITNANLEAIRKRNQGLRDEAEARQLLIQLAREERQLEQRSAEQRLRNQEGNPYLSRSDRLGLLGQQGAGILGQIRDNVRDYASADPQHKIDLMRERNQLEQQYTELLIRQHAIESETSFRDQFANAVQHLRDLNNLAQESAQAFESVFNTAIASISDGITGLIEGTKTWEQALQEVGSAILHEIINAIVTMAVRWIMTSIMMALFGEALVEGAAATYAAAWAAPAILAAIASYGAAAIAAPGEVMGAVAFAPMISAASVAAREHGGPVEAGRPYVVGEKRPELFVPSESGYILPSVPSRMTAQGRGSGDAVNVQPSDVHVLVLYDRQEHLRALESLAGKKIVTKHVRDSRLELGMET